MESAVARIATDEPIELAPSVNPAVARPIEGHTSDACGLLAWIARAGIIGRGVVFIILGGVALNGRGHPVGTVSAMIARSCASR